MRLSGEYTDPTSGMRHTGAGTLGLLMMCVGLGLPAIVRAKDPELRMWIIRMARAFFVAGSVLWGIDLGRNPQSYRLPLK
jgi:hypothetical protein